MPFDHILGVGRSPQITSDVVLNPYTFIQKDISDTAFVKKTLDPLASEVGNEKEIINPDFDSVSNYAYELTHTFSGAGSATSTLLYDYGKSVYLQSIETRLIRNVAAGVNTVVTISFSNDGVNYTTIATVSTGTTDQTISKFYFKTRFIKFTIDTGAAGAGSSYAKFRYLKVLIDPLQY